MLSKITSWLSTGARVPVYLLMVIFSIVGAAAVWTLSSFESPNVGVVALICSAALSGELLLITAPAVIKNLTKIKNFGWRDIAALVVFIVVTTFLLCKLTHLQDAISYGGYSSWTIVLGGLLAGMLIRLHSWLSATILKCLQTHDPAKAKG